MPSILQPTNSTGGHGRDLAAVELDGAIDIWDPATGHHIDHLESRKAPIYHISWGTRFISSLDRDGSFASWLPGHHGPSAEADDAGGVGGSLGPLTYSASVDGTRGVALAFRGSNGLKTVLKLWDARNGRVSELAFSESLVTCAAIDPSANLVAIGDSRGGVAIKDLDRSSPIRELTAIRGARPQYLAFRSDGGRLVALSDRGDLTVYEPRSGRQLISARGPSGKVLASAFVGGRLRIASVSPARERRPTRAGRQPHALAQDFKIWEFSCQ